MPLESLDGVLMCQCTCEIKTVPETWPEFVCCVLGYAYALPTLQMLWLWSFAILLLNPLAHNP
jgi:hypothetical protein